MKIHSCNFFGKILTISFSLFFSSVYFNLAKLFFSQSIIHSYLTCPKYENFWLDQSLFNPRPITVYLTSIVLLITVSKSITQSSYFSLWHTLGTLYYYWKDHCFYSTDLVTEILSFMIIIFFPRIKVFFKFLQYNFLSFSFVSWYPYLCCPLQNLKNCVSKEK